VPEAELIAKAQDGGWRAGRFEEVGGGGLWAPDPDDPRHDDFYRELGKRLDVNSEKRATQTLAIVGRDGRGQRNIVKEGERFEHLAPRLLLDSLRRTLTNCGCTKPPKSLQHTVRDNHGGGFFAATCGGNPAGSSGGSSWLSQQLVSLLPDTSPCRDFESLNKCVTGWFADEMSKAIHRAFPGRGVESQRLGQILFWLNDLAPFQAFSISKFANEKFPGIGEWAQELRQLTDTLPKDVRADLSIYRFEADEEPDFLNRGGGWSRSPGPQQNLWELATEFLSSNHNVRSNFDFRLTTVSWWQYQLEEVAAGSAELHGELRSWRSARSNLFKNNFARVFDIRGLLPEDFSYRDWPAPGGPGISPIPQHHLYTAIALVRARWALSVERPYQQQGLYRRPFHFSPYEPGEQVPLEAVHCFFRTPQHSGNQAPPVCQQLLGSLVSQASPEAAQGIATLLQEVHGPTMGLSASNGRRLVLL